MKVLQVFVLLGSLHLCFAAKILVLVPIPSKSHYILLETVINEIVSRGHDVTVITSFQMLKPSKNLREIVLSGVVSFFDEKTREYSGGEGKFGMRNFGFWSSFWMHELTETLFNKTMEDKGVQKLLNSNEKFDLLLGIPIITEGLMAGLSYKYQVPIVGFTTFMPNVWINEIMGNTAPVAYIPEPLLGLPHKMTFTDRLVNFFCSTVAQIVYNFIHLPSQDSAMRRHFGNDLPPIKSILSNTSIMLVNHHYSLAFPRPLIPNMIEIGGFHVRDPKPLPKDLQQFMDEAKDGVIFFSMGSNLLSAEFPKEKLNGILKAFSKLKQKVLWKFEDENIINLPANVKISKWLPQSDILAHPNTKLFITHGGLLSMTESISRGVPIVGIPIFGDQPANVRLAKNLELGVSVDYDEISETTMLNAIREVLNNPKYTNNVKHRSKLLKDLPMPPLETAMFWIEYVLRHKGAFHLRSGSLDLTWYQRYLIDVYVFIAVVLLVFYKIVCFVIKRITQMCRKKEKNVKKTKKIN